MDQSTTITPETSRQSYDEDFRIWVNAVDEIVNYANDHLEDTWGNLSLIRQWTEITEKIMADHEDRASEHETIAVAHEILATGIYQGVRIDVGHTHDHASGWNLDWPGNGASRRDANNAYLSRIFFASLALNTPDDFRAIVENDVVGLHGTRAVALPSILAARALLSHSNQHDKGILTASGEIHPAPFRRQFISFGDVSSAIGDTYADRDLRQNDTVLSRRIREMYEGYQLRADEVTAFNTFIEQSSDLDPFLKLAAKADFGITIGLSRRAIWLAGNKDEIGAKVSITSDTPEIAFAHQVSINYLPIIGAPKEHHDSVNELIERHGVSMTVFSNEALSRAQASKNHYHQYASKLWRDRL